MSPKSYIFKQSMNTTLKTLKSQQAQDLPHPMKSTKYWLSHCVVCDVEGVGNA